MFYKCKKLTILMVPKSTANALSAEFIDGALSAVYIEIPVKQT